MSEQRRRGRRPKRGERQFGGPQAPGRQRRPAAPKAYGDKMVEIPVNTPIGKGGRASFEKVPAGGEKHMRYLKSKTNPDSPFYVRKGMNIGGRANLLEEMGRIDSEKMNPNRRAEKKRVIGELNRGYKKGGLIKGKPKLAKKGWK